MLDSDLQELTSIEIHESRFPEDLDSAVVKIVPAKPGRSSLTECFEARFGKRRETAAPKPSGHVREETPEEKELAKRANGERKDGLTWKTEREGDFLWNRGYDSTGTLMAAELLDTEESVAKGAEMADRLWKAAGLEEN